LNGGDKASLLQKDDFAAVQAPFRKPNLNAAFSFFVVKMSNR
jgi:hypothetical protein